MATRVNGYGRKEKLKSRKVIAQLFADGKAVTARPLRLVYITPAVPQDVPVKMGVSVSSRNFKKATDRNRIKRLLREAYRLNKMPLLDHAARTGLQLAAFVIYTDKVMPDFELIQKKMKQILGQLITSTSEAISTNS